MLPPTSKEKVPYDTRSPLTESEWDELINNVPPPSGSDDFVKSPSQYEKKMMDLNPKPKAESFVVDAKDADPFSFSFSTTIKHHHLQMLLNGKKQAPGFLQSIGKSMANANYADKEWGLASDLWQLAQHVNPQAAEAVFRNLPPSLQPKVGQAISALKNELDYSPWNSVSKGSGKDGKYPSEYDYYSTHTTKFKVPDNLKNDTKFQEKTKEYAKYLHPEEVKAPTLKEQEFTFTEGGWFNTPKYAPMDAQKLLDFYKNEPNQLYNVAKELVKLDDSYPNYATNVFLKMPKDLQNNIQKKINEIHSKNEFLKMEESYKDDPTYQMHKQRSDFPEEKFQSHEELQDQKVKKLKYTGSGDIYGFFKTYGPDYDKIKIANHFDKVSKPIKDWTKWKPAEQWPAEAASIKPAKLAHITSEQARELGFNPDIPLFHGSSTKKEILKDPMMMPGKYEKAIFSTHDSLMASQYSHGAMLDFIARAPKAAEIEWKDFSGRLDYSHIAMNELIEMGHKKGLNLIVVKNMQDVGGIGDQYLFLTPHKGDIRSVTAKFDPAKLHLGHVHAGLAGGGVFVYGATKGEDDKMNRGGTPMSRITSYARGGPGSTPWNVRKSTHPRQPAGMIKSDVPGRTDKLAMSVPSGSYILPADFPSALGQNNSMAGEKILGAMFKSGKDALKSGPYGSDARADFGKLKKAKAGNSGLQATRTPKGIGRMKKFADGGETEDIPIVAAGGEYVLHPEQVREVGNGDLEAGHRVLDKLVLNIRKRHIETLKKLKPPKR